jgi:hypothetical protein
MIDFIFGVAAGAVVVVVVPKAYAWVAAKIKKPEAAVTAAVADVKKVV